MAVEDWDSSVAKLIDGASFTMSQAYVDLMNGCYSQSHIEWVDVDDVLHEGTLRGTYRYDVDGNQINWQTPMYDSCVRVTMRSGFERFVPFAELWERMVCGQAAVWKK